MISTNCDGRINLFRNGEYLFTIGGHNVDFDDNIWFEINDIISIENVEKLSKEDLENKVLGLCELFKKVDTTKALKGSYNIDLTNKTMKLRSNVEISKFDEVEELRLIDYKYFTQYDKDLWELTCVHFDNVKLLRKKELTFSEYKIFFDFIDKLVNKYKDNQFIINDKFYLKFNFA